MSLFLVGGNFDEKGGRASYIVKQMRMILGAEGIEHRYWNGGYTDELMGDHMRNEMEGVKVLIWMPNVPNSEDKVLPLIKQEFPHIVLVQSKVNRDGEYSDFDLVKRLLESHAALGIVIDQAEGQPWQYRIIDPLGNLWSTTPNYPMMFIDLMSRIDAVANMQRIGSKRIGDSEYFRLEDAFLYSVKTLGEQFDQIIRGVNAERFMGNASTRCCHGFPSVRSADGTVYVSQRNVNKTIITSKQFVKVSGSHDPARVLYWGDNKPSVDTPIQIELYHMFPAVNYMVHGHCYVKDAPFTESAVPCGDVREVDEIQKITAGLMVAHDKLGDFAINLRGHGCLICSSTPEGLLNYEFEARPSMERQA